MNINKAPSDNPVQKRVDEMAEKLEETSCNMFTTTELSLQFCE